MKIAWIFLLFLAASIAASAQDRAIMPVPMEKEPHHHVLFRNEFIEVIRATLLPGESTLFHTHSHNTAGFDL